MTIRLIVMELGKFTATLLKSACDFFGYGLIRNGWKSGEFMDPAHTDNSDPYHNYKRVALHVPDWPRRSGAWLGN